MPDTVLCLRGLTKRFGYRWALAGLDLEVAAGEFVVLLGANGAGKSTLLSVLATRGRATAGRYELFGADAWRARHRLRARLGLVAHESLLAHDLSLRENLRFFAVMYGVRDARARIEALLAAVGLESRGDDPVSTFSRGMVQRAALARALLHEPELLLLDEPFSGLDAAGRRALAAVLAARHAAGTTVLLVTHHAEQAVAPGRRYVVLDQGRVHADVAEADAARAALARLLEGARQ